MLSLLVFESFLLQNAYFSWQTRDCRIIPVLALPQGKTAKRINGSIGLFGAHILSGGRKLRYLRRGPLIIVLSCEVTHGKSIFGAPIINQSRFFGEGDATKHVSVKNGFFSEKGGGNSVNEGFDKDFYRKGNSVKRFGPFTDTPDSEN